VQNIEDGLSRSSGEVRVEVRKAWNSRRCLAAFDQIGL
jgi:hypothetical protein